MKIACPRADGNKQSASAFMFVPRTPPMVGKQNGTALFLRINSAEPSFVPSAYPNRLKRETAREQHRKSDEMMSSTLGHGPILAAATSHRRPNYNLQLAAAPVVYNSFPAP